METPIVKLKAGKERSILRRHPWIFAGAVEKVLNYPNAGDTVQVFSAGGELLGEGAYSPKSQIRVRMWHFERELLDIGNLIAQRLKRAINLRKKILPEAFEPSGACRLVFSEADGLPGLIVDKYDDILVCQFLSVGAEKWREIVVNSLQDLLAPEGIYERSDSEMREREGLSGKGGILRGKLPEKPLLIRENDRVMMVDIVSGHKTGLYLDQRVNRSILASFSQEAEVLDAFSFNGGFAVAALAGGATSVTLLDASQPALEAARQNIRLNKFPASAANFIHGNAFEELRRLAEARHRFDVIVLDPPKFVASAQQLKKGLRGYKEINMQGLKLVKPGGYLLTFSCSGHVSRDIFQKMLAGAALDAGREVQLLQPLWQAPDHPVPTRFPEAEYLKGWLCEVW